MAAVSGVAVSVGTGSLAVGSATLLISSASVAKAALSGPYDNEGNPLEYSDVAYEVDPDDLAEGRNWMHFNSSQNVNLTVDFRNYDPSQAKSGRFGVQADAGSNLKITLTGANASAYYSLTSDSSVHSSSVWLTGSMDADGNFVGKNALQIGQDIFTSDIKDIYIEQVALQFVGSYQGQKELAANLILGASSYANGQGRPAMDGSTLVVGTWENSNVINVTTTGDLIVREDAKVGFFTPGSSLVVKGALSGSGTLSLASISNGPGYLYLMGGSDKFTGALNLNANATRVYFGQDIELGGLTGAANNVYFGLSEVGSITLTLNVTRDMSFTGVSNTATVSDLWDRNIYLVKKGVGKQVLSSFSGSGVSIEEQGELDLTNRVWIGSRGVTVAKGGVLHIGSSGYTADFAGGQVSVSNGSLILAGSVSMRDTDLILLDEAYVSYTSDSDRDSISLGNITLGGERGGTPIMGAVLSLNGKVRLNNAELNLISGTLELGGSVSGISRIIEVGEDVTLRFLPGTELDVSGLGAGVITADVDSNTFGYTVDVLRVADGGIVEGWRGENSVRLTGGFDALEEDNGIYRAGVSWSNTVIVRDLQTISVNWLNGHQVEGVQTWVDSNNSSDLTKTSIAVIVPGSVTFVTGRDIKLNSDPLPAGDNGSRIVENIFVAENTTLRLRQYRNSIYGTYGGNVRWHKMLLMGDLVLQDRDVIARDNYYNDEIAWGPGAHIIVDWCFDGVTNMGNYAAPGRRIGNSSHLPGNADNPYTGTLVVQSGVFELQNTDRFDDVIVKEGAQATIRTGDYTGNITISGKGVNMANSEEINKSALKLGNNRRLKGNLTIADEATVHVWRGESAWIEGQLIGSGLGEFSFVQVNNTVGDHENSHLYVMGDVKGIKLFNIEQDANLYIQSDFDASNIDEAAVASRRFDHLSGGGNLHFQGALTGFDRFTVGASSHLVVTDIAGKNIFGADIRDFVKDGAGTMDIYRNFETTGKVTVNGGTLRFGNPANAADSTNYRFYASDIEVMNSCTFVLTHNYENFGTNVVLSDGTFVNGGGWTSADSYNKYFKFGTLTVTGGSSILSWAAATNVNEGFVFDLLTGNGDLQVGAMNNGGNNSQIFRVDEIVNYSGSLTSSISTFNNTLENKKFIIGTVHQDSGQNGAISLTSGHVSSSGFRKTGAGEFSINTITFDTEVWMNYEGTLKLGDVKFLDNTILHYTTGDNERVILSSDIENDSDISRLYIDILDLSNEELASGVNLGFYANVSDAGKIRSKLVVGGMSEEDYELYTQNGRLYLRSSVGVNMDWDRAMGVISMAWAPTRSVLSQHLFGSTITGTQWTLDAQGNVGVGALLELGSKSNYAVQKSGQLTTVVQLTNQSGGDYATVMGGKSSTGMLFTQSYIYMAGGHYYMLIGGGANLSVDGVGSGGVNGGSHIQIESGSVDYIVGGNHLSSGGYVFEGDSYVSFQGGTLRGGIVGGSTYAGSGGAFGRETKHGSSNIFIYTALANADDTPTIGVLETYKNSAAPFTKVVGGSAYVSYGDSSAPIAFYGDSNIVVNLSSYTGEDSFDKDIIGGNAYLIGETDAENKLAHPAPDAWSSTFEGDSSITITGTRKDGKSILFSGTVAGASEHNVHGNQQITFTGDATVSVRGGEFRQAVAGGFYIGSESVGSHIATFTGDSSVTLNGGSFWRVVGGSYSLGTGEGASYLMHKGNTSLEITSGTFTAEVPDDAAEVDPETWRSFVTGGSYLTANRNDASPLTEEEGGAVYPHVHDGEAKLLITGGSFHSTLIVGGDFISASPAADYGNSVYPVSRTIRGTYADISGATITDALVVGGGYLADTSEYGGIEIGGGSFLTIGEGARIEASDAADQYGIAATAGSYLNVAGDNHHATIENGTTLTMVGGSVTGHLVGGSVMTGYANSLETDSITVLLSGGSVMGNVYGGHYVGKVAVTSAVSATSAVTDAIDVTLDGAAVTGNIFGGGSFSCGEGYGSESYIQQQADIVVHLMSGSLTGNVYAAGELGRPADILQEGEDSITPDGARVMTDSTRVELSSAFAFGSSKSVVSGDYLEADARYHAYQGEVTGDRTLVFTDDGNYAAIKNWSGVSFIHFDVVEVADNATVVLSKAQFTGEETGFYKTGGGTLELGGALPGNAPLYVLGGTLRLTEKQKLGGGLHFDLTGRQINDASTALLQGLGGFEKGIVDIYLEGELDSIGYGTYYLVSGWNADEMGFSERFGMTDVREFILKEDRDSNCLILNVRERSNDKWLWRGDTNHSVVGAYEWDSKYAANWNAHEMAPATTETPEGKNVRFTASVGGEVKIGELVHPSSVTVESGNYVFTQRSDADSPVIEGIWTDRLSVGGAYQEAVLELQLGNRNINNIFLENNGTLILSHARAIVSSIDRPTENSIIYFNGGTIIYGEEFDKDISWQVDSDSSSGIVRVGIAGNHVEDDRIVWGKLYDSEAADTWSYNGALNIALQRGIEKSGEGTLRMQWGDSHGNIIMNGVDVNAYTGTVDVKEGVLECLISAFVGSANLRKFSNVISVAADAEFVLSVARSLRVSLEDSLAGEGTVVLGRQLDEPNVFFSYGTISCGAQYHGGLLTDIMDGAYVIGADNRDFAGTLVLEGDGTRGNSDYVTIGRRLPGEEENLIGYDSDSQTLTALGGGQTTLVLAGRHITIDGLVHAHAHNNPDPYEIDSNLVPYGTWALGGREKYIRAGVVEVREGTLNYLGSTTRDAETDNTRIHATAYRPWDDNIIITGKLIGSGTLATPWGYHSNLGQGDGQGHAWYGGYYGHTLQGAISEFTGTLVAGDIQSWRDSDHDINSSASSWTFFAASATDVPGARSIINARLAGAGTMYFMYTQDTVLAGVVGDIRAEGGYGNSLRLTNNGTGTIILGNNHNTATGLLYLSEGDFALGDEDHYANWAGKYIRGSADRSFILVNGELTSPMERVEGSEVRFRVVTSDLGATKVNAGGTQGSDLFEVTINKGGFLSGVYGDIVASRDGSTVKLVFGKSNITSSAGAEADHMIELRFNSKLSIEDANYFLLDFSVDSIVELLRELGNQPQSAAYLHVLSRGELDIHKALWSQILADGGSGARLLAQLGLHINDVSGGDIIMGSVGGHRAYQVFSDPSSSDPHTVDQYDVLSGFDAVILEKGQTLNITLTGAPTYGTRDYQAGGAVVPNLWGDRNTSVNVRNGNPNRGNISVIFYNATEEGVGTDSEFYGTIDGGEHVDFVKDGAGQLTIGYHDRSATTGGFNGETLNIRQGAVIMQGESNKIGKLTFSYRGDEPAEGENRGLSLLNGKTTIKSIVEAGDHAGPIILGNNAEFNLVLDSREPEEVDKEGEEDYKKNHVNVWNDLVVMRQGAQSTGTFAVVGGEVYMTNAKEAQLQGVHLDLQKNALLSLSCLEGASVASLNGNGTLMAEAAGTLELTSEGNGLFTGTLGSSHVGENTLHISNNIGTLTLRTVKNEGMWSVHNDGKLVIDVSGKYSRAANNNIKLNHFTLGDDSQTTYIINSDHCIDNTLSEMLTANSLTVGNRATLTIESEGNMLYNGKDHLIIANVGAGSSTDGLMVELVGFSFFLNEVKRVRVDMDGNLRVELAEVTGNPLSHPNMDGNALAGAQLLYDAAASEYSRWKSLSIEEYQDLRDLINGMSHLREEAKKTGDYSTMDRALAASAGASTAILGPAMAQDMQRQLQAIRNRTTTMGANPNYAAGDGPVWHAWINAEGNYHQQDADNLAPGFKLNSWGGTVGMDADVSARSNVGLALTAMYGSLDANSPDKGDGKMDTYYLSFFGKTSRGRWMHTFVGSIGLASVSLDRSVDYGYGSYTTTGSTNGYAFGLMYEVGYSVPLNDEASFAIQPVANVALRHIGISGYEENGHGAQLRVGDISQTILTLGAGVRAQAVVGENMYNRTSILEGRLLVKLDSGDTKGTSTTSLVNGSPLSVPVSAAEVGSVGVEVGVGITIPMDNTNGSVFFDASAEIRSGYTNMNATVGYRVDF